MAITNKDGYDFVNTVLRKEKEGSALTPDRFNNMLNFSFWQKVDDEYIKFEKDQNSTDFFNLLKKYQEIAPDGDGEYLLTGLNNDYFHYCYSSYNGTYIDLVTEIEWSKRISSSLEYPTEDFPICKISDNYAKFFPLKHNGGTEASLAINSGWSGTTDWVDTNTDGVADGYQVTNSGEVLQADGQFYFDGRAQGVEFSPATIASLITDNTPFADQKNYYFEFEYYIETGSNTPGVVGVWNGGSSYYSEAAVVGAKTFVNGTIFLPDNFFTNSNLGVYCNIDVAEADRYIYIDKLKIIPLNTELKIGFSYLKKPAQPYFDWYYDANDNIQYLEEGEVYTLLANERYIDKTDGTVLTSGSVIGTAANDAVNQTKEMEVPEDGKEDVFISILSKLGISMANQGAVQYSMSMEAKEDTR